MQNSEPTHNCKILYLSSGGVAASVAGRGDEVMFCHDGASSGLLRCHQHSELHRQRRRQLRNQRAQMVDLRCVYCCHTFILHNGKLPLENNATNKLFWRKLFTLLVFMRNFFTEKLSLKSWIFFLYLELDYIVSLIAVFVNTMANWFLRQEQWIRGARYASSWGRLIPTHRDINNRWTHLITLLSMHSTSISLPPSQWYWSPWTLQVSACWDHSLSLAMTTLRPAMPKWNSQTSEFLLRTCCWEKDEASRLLRW